MLRKSPSAVWWLAIVSALLIGSVGSIVFIYAPVNPSITFTFRVRTISGYSIQVGPTAYMKATLLGSAGVVQGQILLSRLDTNTGPYYLLIMVSYGNSSLSNQTFTMIGDAGYQFKVIYGSRTENTAIPYSITLSLLSSTQQVLATQIITIYPT